MKKEDIIKILDQVYKQYSIDVEDQKNIKIYTRGEYLYLFDDKLEAADFIDNCYTDNIIRRAEFILMFSDYPDYGIIHGQNSTAGASYEIIHWLREIDLII